MSESVQSEGAAAEIPIRWEDAAGVSRGIMGGGCCPVGSACGKTGSAVRAVT